MSAHSPVFNNQIIPKDTLKILFRSKTLTNIFLEILCPFEATWSKKSPILTEYSQNFLIFKPKWKIARKSPGYQQKFFPPRQGLKSPFWRKIARIGNTECLYCFKQDLDLVYCKQLISIETLVHDCEQKWKTCQTSLSLPLGNSYVIVLWLTWQRMKEPNFLK